MTDQAATDALADSPADVTVSPPKLLSAGYHSLERFTVTLRSPGDRGELTSVRDVLHVGKVTAVLPIDIARGELVLIRQFRLPAHLATGAGELTEIVAGHVEAGETPAEAAMRECVEEIGVRPAALYEMLEFIPVPGSSDEHAFMFLGPVDATRIPQLCGRRRREGSDAADARADRYGAGGARAQDHAQRIPHHRAAVARAPSRPARRHPRRAARPPDERPAAGHHRLGRGAVGAAISHRRARATSGCGRTASAIRPTSPMRPHGCRRRGRSARSGTCARSSAWAPASTPWWRTRRCRRCRSCAWSIPISRGG